MIHFFYGEECHLAEPRIKGLVRSWIGTDAEDFGLTLFESDPGIPELANAIDSIPFFGDRKAVRIRDSRWFQAARRKAADVDDDDDTGGAETAAGDNDGLDPRLLRLLENVPQNCMLVIQAVKVDKRKKIFKKISELGQVVEYGLLRSGDELAIRTWTEDCLRQDGKTMAKDAMRYLIDVVGTMPQISRSFIAKELEKAVLYVGEDPVITRQALEAVMAAVPELNAFIMTEALGARNATQALETFHALLAMREPELKIIGLLAFKIRQWLKVRQVIDGGGTDADMFAVLGSKGGSPAMVRRLSQQSRSFSQENLKNALLLLADANCAVRSGGDARLLMERAIIELTG